ncbi:MAG: hypothetical protein WC570_00335 [Patescibacteria group bacterium]
MNKTIKTSLWIISILIIVAIILAIIFWPKKPIVQTTYSQDTTIDNLNVESNKTVLIANNAILTVTGNATIDGTLQCANGPINLVINGQLNVGGKLICDRGQDLPEGDTGQGINLIVKNEVMFADQAMVVTNGHVQIVDDATLLAQTETEINQAFDEISQDSGGESGYQIGPFIPIEVIDGQVYTPQAANNDTTTKRGDNNLAKQILSEAHAQTPATDAFGNPVPGIELRGTWYLGNPNVTPPPLVDIPTPPKRIKKILFFFQTASNRQMILRNMSVFAPDGSPGDNKSGGCDLTGDIGINALRMKAEMYRITVDNLNLYLGDGGSGGNATTDTTCRDGYATGGAGGEAGDLKMIAGDRLEIIGALRIFPGEGGTGGTATAYGDNGDNGNPGEDGGNAFATGGQGGDNKKGLKIMGNVAGINNIELHSLRGGLGGNANAYGGNGGNGAECGHLGGRGGNATATGGAGGLATSKSVESFGGDGGDVTAVPGHGGNGGSCGADKAGGDGGDGGDANATPGTEGTGQTANGTPGSIIDQAGGAGGNGGDGCPEGLGGLGGLGIPLGNNGNDGVNKCVGEIKKPAPRIAIGFDPDFIETNHFIGTTSCPQPLGDITFTGPENGSIDILNLPGWLNMDTHLDFQNTNTIVSPLNFNCNISNYSPHTEMVQLELRGTDSSGQEVVVPEKLPVELNVQ